MNTEEFRSVQAPLKERYREATEMALITCAHKDAWVKASAARLRRTKRLSSPDYIPPPAEAGTAPCSGDRLLEALVACAGVTLNAVATAIGIELRDASLQAEGDLDFRGTLGLSKEVPVGFQNIRLQFTLDTDASEEQIATLLRLTEMYCVVYQTLAHPCLHWRLLASPAPLERRPILPSSGQPPASWRLPLMSNDTSHPTPCVRPAR